jgi:hypothetical protein
LKQQKALPAHPAGLSVTNWFKLPLSFILVYENCFSLFIPMAIQPEPITFIVYNADG